MDARWDETRLVLERTDDGETIVLDLAPERDDLLIGEARLGSRSAPFAARRIESLDARELDPFLGAYSTEEGERVFITRLPVATRHGALAWEWTVKGIERTLFPVGREEDASLRFVHGPSFRRPGPTEGEVRFAADGSSFEWRDTDGEVVRAERHVLAFDDERIARFMEGALERTTARTRARPRARRRRSGWARPFAPARLP